MGYIMITTIWDIIILLASTIESYLWTAQEVTCYGHAYAI